MLACCCYLKNTGVAAGMSQKCTYKPDQRKKRIYTDVRFCTNSLDSSSWIIKQIHWFNFPYRSLKRLLSRLQLRLLKDSRQLIAAAAIWNPICGAHVATGSAAGRPFVCNDRVFCVRKNVKGNLTGKPAAAPASASSLQTAASTRSGRIRAGTTCFWHRQGKSLFHWRWSDRKSCPVCFTWSFSLWTVEPFWLLASVLKGQT